MIFEFLFIGGGAIFLLQEWRRGFPVSKRLYANVYNRATGNHRGEIEILGPVQVAEQIVTRYAQSVAKLEESVAQVIANKRSMEQRALEEGQLAVEAQEIMEEALGQGNEEVAQLAANKKVNHLERQRMFEANAERQIPVAEKLQTEFDILSNKLELVQTSAETIRVQAHIASVNQQLHNLLSDVSQVTGLSLQGQLSDLVRSTQNEQYKTEALLEIDAGKQKVADFQLSARARKEIEDTRKRVSLPSPQQEEAP